MARNSTRTKPTFAKNIVARRKALGWNGHKLAEKAGVPYPTLRDIEAGISSGREDTKRQIAIALGCQVSELYEERELLPTTAPILRLTQLIEAPGKIDHLTVSRVVQELLNVEPVVRATVLAVLYDDPSIAEPYLSKTGTRAKHLKAR